MLQFTIFPEFWLNFKGQKQILSSRVGVGKCPKLTMASSSKFIVEEREYIPIGEMNSVVQLLKRISIMCLWHGFQLVFLRIKSYVDVTLLLTCTSIPVIKSNNLKP